MNKSFLAMLLSLVSSFTMAGDGMDLLKKFHKQVQSLEATFVQTVTANRNKPPQVSSGTVVLKRPDQFRWEYKEPFPQTIVSDGKTIWLYDSDLEQVTIKKVKSALGNAPSMVLSGKRPLENDFTITEINRGDDLVWLELVPRKKDTDFESISVAFSDGQINQLELKDNLGQTTLIKFNQLNINPDVKAKRFQFSIPPNVEVVGNPVK